MLASLEAASSFIGSNNGQRVISQTLNAAMELRHRLMEVATVTPLRVLDSYDHIDSDYQCDEILDKYDLLVDPLRLSVRFEGVNALNVDDTMCEGKSFSCYSLLRA